MTKKQYLIHLSLAFFFVAHPIFLPLIPSSKALIFLIHSVANFILLYTISLSPIMLKKLSESQKSNQYFVLKIGFTVLAIYTLGTFCLLSPTLPNFPMISTLISGIGTAYSLLSSGYPLFWVGFGVVTLASFYQFLRGENVFNRDQLEFVARTLAFGTLMLAMLYLGTSPLLFGNTLSNSQIALHPNATSLLLLKEVSRKLGSLLAQFVPATLLFPIPETHQQKRTFKTTTTSPMSKQEIPFVETERAHEASPFAFLLLPTNA